MMVYKKGHIQLVSASIFSKFRGVFFAFIHAHSHTHTPLSEAFRINRILIHLEQKGWIFLLFVYLLLAKSSFLSPPLSLTLCTRVCLLYFLCILLSIQVETLCVKCMLIGLNYKVIATNPFIPRISFNVGCVGSIQHHLTHRSHSHRVIYFKWYKALPSH